MKLLSSSQIKSVDALTIERQHILSIDLMERAAMACVDFIHAELSKDTDVIVCCGMGNNGGDGLAIARLLNERNVNVRVVIAYHSEQFSHDSRVNFDRLNESLKSDLISISAEQDAEQLQFGKKHLVIDALLGTGVNKPMSGVLKAVADKINTSPCKVISIDVPSGLLADSSSKGFHDCCIHADLVLSLQLPKLAYLMPENKNIVPAFQVIDIGLDEQAINEQASELYFAEAKNIRSVLALRSKFSHKGTYGHALLFAGSEGKPGAALISSEACLRSGAGLLTVHSTRQVADALASRLPEAMASIDEHSSMISRFVDLIPYNALGFGPGTGTSEETQQVLKAIIQQYQGKLLIDADGLNILSENKTWLDFLPQDTILTPHPKEFERLAGSFEDDFDRLKKAGNFAVRYKCILVLKDTYTHICMPDGSVVFNPTGNPGLAKGGSGDALTGVILGLLARGYSPPKAVLIGTYVHGLAADLCAQEMSMESILITDVIQKLPMAFKVVESSGNKQFTG